MCEALRDSLAMRLACLRKRLPYRVWVRARGSPATRIPPGQFRHQAFEREQMHTAEEPKSDRGPPRLRDIRLEQLSNDSPSLCILRGPRHQGGVECRAEPRTSIALESQFERDIVASFPPQAHTRNRTSH